MSRALTCLFLLASLFWLDGCGGEKTSRQEQDFAQRYRAAHDSGAVEQAMALYWMEGVTDEDRFLLQMALTQELTYPIQSIAFEPVEPDDAYHYEHDGREWGPNLTPARRFVVVFDIPEKLHASFLLGEHEGQYYFVNASPTRH